MPTVAIPLAGQNDFRVGATFLAKSHAQVGMVANIINPYVSHDLYLLAFFIVPSKKNLPLVATFKKTSTLALSSVFVNPKHIFSVPMSSHFYVNTSTKSLSSHATFKAPKNLTLSAHFTQQTFANLRMSAGFGSSKTLGMSATFNGIGVSSPDLLLKAFLGTLETDFQFGVTFIQSATTDFFSIINIQPYVSPKGTYFTSLTDIPATIMVRGRPSVDLAMGANFGGVVPNSFPAIIEIINPYHGPSNILVIAENIGGDAVREKIVTITALSDSEGYFNLTNLVAGTYEVFPQQEGLAFTPPSVIVDLTDSNVTLYFTLAGTFEAQAVVSTPIAPPTACFVNITNSVPNFGVSVFSINGYISSSGAAFGTSILATAWNITEAENFIATFNQNVGG